MATAPDYIAIIREIDSFINASENAVSKSTQAFQKVLIDNLRLALASLLDIDSNNNIKSSVDNLQQLNSIRKRLDVLFASQEYTSIVREATNQYNAIAENVTQYFLLSAPEFAENQIFATDLINQIRGEAVEMLQGEGLKVNISNQIEKIIIEGIDNGAPLRSVEASLNEYLSKKSGALTRYTKQITTDSLNTFSRAYTNQIAEGLDLQHYFYSGTEIQTTRSFCDKRVGNYYTKEEIESWSSKKWEGKKKGTNKDTIFVYLGGYNCRHKLIPVSETMYNRNK